MAMSDPQASASGKSTSGAAQDGFTDEERAAMKERARELKASARRGSKVDRAEAEREVLAKIAELEEPDRTIGERIHAIVTAAAPDLLPRTWYGMPAYAKDGKVICFFQAASKFKVRYATFGFQPDARLDDGPMWATSFALTELTPMVEARITDLVRQATS
jgi:uncharacterized protein YdhG (YjbR/CyaY superfamily)